MRSSFTGRLLAAWLIVSAGLTPAPIHSHALASPGDSASGPEIRRLTLNGVHSVDEHDLQKSISTTASSCKNIFFYPFCKVSNSSSFIDKRYLDREEFRLDVLRIRAYYWKRGYRKTDVDTSVTPIEGRGSDSAVAVTFDIRENEPTLIRKMSILYDSSLISERTRRKLTLVHVDDPLNLILVDSTRLRFEEVMWALGHSDADADTTVTVNADTTYGDVAVTVIPNWKTITGPIRIVGNANVDRSTILSTISLRTGKPFRRTDVPDSQRDLYTSGLFRQVTVLVPFQRDSVKRVDIGVMEAPLHDARAGAGVNNIDFVQIEAGYTVYNLFGGARRLSFTGTAGNLLAPVLAGVGPFRDIRAEVPDSVESDFLHPTWLASLDFEQPSFLHRPGNVLGFGVFGHRQQNPGVFIDNGYGGTATLTREVRPRAPVSLNYRYEISRLQASDVYFCVNYGVCDIPTIATLRTHSSLSPLTLTGFADRADEPLSPTKGYVARVDLEYATKSTGSDYQYNRGFLDAAAYTHRSGHRDVYTAHLRIGMVSALGGDEILHPRKRFYAGGAQSVRGFQENQLGPRILTIAPERLDSTSSSPGGTCDLNTPAIAFCNPNSPRLDDGDFIPQPLGGTLLLEGSVEWRFPLAGFRHFTGAVFVDAGVVGDDRLQAPFDLLNITKGVSAITPGFGVRYDSPVGPIRFDIGIAPTRTEQLPVVTSLLVNGQNTIVPLTASRVYQPVKSLLDRLILHFSIGQAY
jgi:outer membrane protein insertion porin family